MSRSTCSRTWPFAGATSTASARSASSARWLLLALIPAAVELPALASLAIATALLWVLIAYETVRFAELRDRLRHQLAHEGAAPD